MPFAVSGNTYKEKDFDRIAEAIDKPVRLIEAYASKFESAAMWYRLDCRSRKQIAPSKIKRKLAQVETSARHLLKNLGIENIDEAADGPGDDSIFDLLASVDGMSPDTIGAATDRIGRMAAVLEGIAATYELERAALAGIQDVEKIGKLTVPKGHLGDAAINAWTAAMMSAYRDITESLPRTSTISSGENEGEASGPLIRFLEAAGKPLCISYGAQAWRSRIRRILKNSD